jgi:HD superfamily phosphodiesterase
VNFLDPEAAETFVRTAFADQPARLQHILVVAEQVRQSARAIHARHPAEPIDEGAAHCAGLVHDIGYLAQARETGFHPLDGYRFLREHGAESLARCIVGHSSSPEEARLRGLSLPDGTEDIAAKLVTYWDMRVKQGGEIVSYAERLEDILRRHGRESVVGQAQILADGRIRRLISEIEERWFLR